MSVADPGRLYRVVERQRAAVLRGERQAASELVRAYGGVWQRIRREVEILLQARAEQEALGIAVGPEWLLEYNRLGVLQRQVEAELRVFAELADPLVTRMQADAVDAALAHAEEQVRTVAGKTTAQLKWTQLPTSAVEDLLGFAADGSPLRELFDALGPQASALVRSELLQGLALGWHPTQIAEAIRGALGGNLARALMIARTEMLRAYREATRRSYQANDDIVDGWVWNCACTTRSCAMCVTGDTVVSGPLPEKVFTRHYTGDIVVIQTASGKHLSITPNHPILTQRGWINAGTLKEGDDVISSADSDGAALAVGVDNYHMPAVISKVAESFGVIATEMECSTPDFHGDGIGSKIYVVRSNGLLRNELQLSGFQHGFKDLFAMRSAGAGSNNCFGLPCFSDVATLFERLLVRLGMIAKDPFPFFQGNLVATQSVGFGGCSAFRSGYAQTGCDGRTSNTECFCNSLFSFTSKIAGGNFGVGKLLQVMTQSSVLTASHGIPLFLGAQQSAFPENFGKTLPTDTELGSNLLGCLTGKVGLDRVLKVTIRRFSGHVYNLQTESGWYFSNGIITHNCWAMHGTVHPLSERLDDHPNGRCSMVPHVRSVAGMPEQPQPELGPVQFARLTEAQQDGILGRAMGNAYRAGALRLEDVVGRTFNPDWGSMRRVRSLREILGPEAAAKWLHPPQKSA